MNGARIVIWALAAATVGLPGCVERQLNVTSDPSGALVFLADEEIGRTPLTVDFTWYGDYEVVLRQDGYETLTTHTQINPPIYDIPPWDLISQAFVPWTYRYHVQRHFTMVPQSQPSDETLIQRAEELRDRLGTGTKP
jgi:hypothetical protein